MTRRAHLLCEDKRAERFLRRLCDRYRVRVAEVTIAPNAEGSAENWVRKQYPRVVRKIRSKNFQKGLGLIVHIDGDNQGLDKRCRALDQGLKELGLSAKEAHEPIALFVPTWCIETWLLHLSATGQPGEDVQVKHEQPYCDLVRAWDRIGSEEAAILDRSVAGWPGNGALPSLCHAVNDARKVGLG